MAASPAIYQLDTFRPHSLAQTILSLIAADIASLWISVAVSLSWKNAMHGIADWGPYLRLWPFLFVFLAAYGAAGLYSGVALSPPQELRRSTVTSAVIFLFLGVATMSLRGGTRYVTSTLLIAMTLSMILIPLLRGFTRYLFAHEEWWGTSAVVFGSGSCGRDVVKALLDQPGLGLKPVAIVDD